MQLGRNLADRNLFQVDLSAGIVDVDSSNEPAHIHCQKGEAEAKYWLDAEEFEALEAHAYNMSPADKRVVRRIIFEHFDYIVSEWTRWQERRDG